MCVCVCFAGWLTTNASPRRFRWIPVLLNGPASHHPPPLPPPRQLWGWRAAERPAGETTHTPPRLIANVRDYRVTAESPQLLPQKYLNIIDFLHAGDFYRTKINRISHKVMLSFMYSLTFCYGPQSSVFCLSISWWWLTAIDKRCKNTLPQGRDLQSTEVLKAECM